MPWCCARISKKSCTSGADQETLERCDRASDAYAPIALVRRSRAFAACGDHRSKLDVTFVMVVLLPFPLTFFL
jgi:hypothetical protein